MTYPAGLDLVDIHEIPPYVLDRWRPALDACPDLGLRTKFCLRVPVLGRAENFNMVLVRDDGEFTVTLTFERYIVQNRERIYVTTNIASRLNDDRRAVTTDSRRAVALLPEIVTQAVTGRSLPEMVAAHRDWLAANALTVIPVLEASLERTILARFQATFDRNVERGLYVRISERRLRETGPAELARFAAPVTRMAGAEQDRVQLVAGPCRGGRLLARHGRALDRGAEALRRGRVRRVLRPVRTPARGQRDSFLGGSLSGVRQDRARGDRRLTEQFGYDLAWVALQRGSTGK